jgi:Nif-specific regulatory protein
MTSANSMSNVVQNDLNTQLLMTLDESIFFLKLTSSLVDLLKVEGGQAFVTGEDQTAILVADTKNVIIANRVSKTDGINGHIMRTRRPYFSNNISRDPAFAQDLKDNKNILAQLSVPVIVNDIMIAILHFQMNKEGRDFTREDITRVQDLLISMEKPLTNIKMFLTAKLLNETLQKKIEEKERQIEMSERGPKLDEVLRIQEKEVIGKSEEMKSLLRLADKASLSEVNLLLRGESGVGKEVIARRVHCRGARRDQAFMTVDCSSYTESQLDVEIFGEEANAVKNVRMGALELSNKGTLLLENIQQMPMTLQAKLSMALKEGIAHKVGGKNPYKINVRLMTSTVANLVSLIEAAKFREDLYYRLNTIMIDVPSLRSRQVDLELLANYFLNKGKSVDKHKSFSPGAINSMIDYNWPGNIRELQNVAERAYILSEGMIVEREHLADSVKKIEKVVDAKKVEEKVDYSEMTLEQLERRHIVFTLDHLSGNKTKTAKMLGITVKTLYNKLHSYGLIEAREDASLQ